MIIARINMKATYIKTDLTSIINVSKVVTIHYYEFDKNFVFEGERHNFWEMVYVDKGQVEICREDAVQIFSQGELVFHRPNEFHAIRAHNSSPNFFVISFVCLSPAMAHFEGFHTVLEAGLKPFLSSIIYESEKTFQIPKNDPTLKRLEKKENATIGGEQLIKLYLEELLIHLMRGMAGKNNVMVFQSKESMETQLVVDIKAYIEKNVSEVFRVDALCKQTGYGKSYLSRVFREQTGKTLAAYAIQMKIKKAKVLIRESELNFAQISYRLSFDNPQYFSRVFKRVTGMTPTEFKASLQFKEEA
jgi:AraC-like DNA-binding protein/quercetin dioxygenase-like cupin family protein